MEFDDWNLSAEDLDFLEKDAFRQLSERKSSSSSASVSSPPPVSSRNVIHPSPAKISLESRFNKAEVEPTLYHAQPTLDKPRETERESSKDLPRLTVKLLLHASGNVAAKFNYHQLLVGACHMIPKAGWNAKERLWMFPVSSLQSAEKVFSEIPGASVEVLSLDVSLLTGAEARSSGKKGSLCCCCCS